MKTSEELYTERTKRVQDGIELKVPDRVPFTPTFSFFPAKYAGVTCQEAMYEPDKLSLAYKKAVLDFEPDMYSSYAKPPKLHELVLLVVLPLPPRLLDQLTS